jgi:CheY-like chemotaxis protein
MRSVLGRGSLFSVELPQAAPRAATDQAMIAAPTAGRIAGLKVLCIDNEPDVLNGMQALLEGWGCVTQTAQNAVEAIDQLRRTGDMPDIVLADFHLDGGTGLEAVAAVHSAVQSQIPVIVITADHSAEVQREIRKLGYALLRKPLKAAALRALMYQLTLQRAVAAE